MPPPIWSIVHRRGTSVNEGSHRNIVLPRRRSGRWPALSDEHVGRYAAVRRKCHRPDKLRKRVAGLPTLRDGRCSVHVTGAYHPNDVYEPGRSFDGAGRGRAVPRAG